MPAKEAKTLNSEAGSPLLSVILNLLSYRQGKA
jgi:hypothetical protein